MEKVKEFLSKDKKHVSSLLMWITQMLVLTFAPFSGYDREFIVL